MSMKDGSIFTCDVSVILTLLLFLFRVFWTNFQSPEIRFLMSQNNFRLSCLSKTAQIVSASMPIVIVPCQSARVDPLFIIFLNMESISCKQDRACLLKVKLHGNGSSCMSRTVMQNDTLIDLKNLPGKCPPVQAVNNEVVFQVWALIYSRSTCPKGIFQLILVTPNFDVYQQPTLAYSMAAGNALTTNLCPRNAPNLLHGHNEDDSSQLP